MKKRFLVLISFILPLFASAQNAGAGMSSGSSEGKTYWKTASEFIFSMGNMELSDDPDSGAKFDVSPVVRFSGFFHFQAQFHIDFGKSVGMYTGFGMRNIGMINKVNDSIRVKQRAYSIGVPLAFKFGNMKKGYVAIGGEAELMFHYKQKVFYDDQKKKNSDWFSDKVNLFNPSGYVEFVSGRGSYIRFKYYFLDFLVDDKQDVRLYDGTPITYIPEKSQLFSVSVGATIRHGSGNKNHKVTPGDRISMIY